MLFFFYLNTVGKMTSKYNFIKDIVEGSNVFVNSENSIEDAVVEVADKTQLSAAETGIAIVLAQDALFKMMFNNKYRENWARRNNLHLWFVCAKV